MMIDCDKNMIVHLLRNWRPNRLRAQGFRLARLRPRLIAMQNGVCALCPESLVNDGKVTHIGVAVSPIILASKYSITSENRLKIDRWASSKIMRSKKPGLNFSKQMFIVWRVATNSRFDVSIL